MNVLRFIPLTGVEDIIDETSALQEATDTVANLSEKVTTFNIMDYLPQMINWGVKILIVLLIWFAGKQLSKLLVHVFEHISEANGFDPSISGFISKLVKCLMYILIISTILNYLDIGTASLVAVLGSAGLAVGLSLQGSLANFAGSIIILLMKPFKVGDYIVTGLGEGAVQSIGLIYTTITTVDNKNVSIPNGALANTNITNASANPTRMVNVTVDISYDSDIKKAKELIEAMISDTEYRVPETPVKVFVKSLASSSIIVEGRVIVNTENYWDATWELQEKIKGIFDASGIEIPFNQLDVHVR